MNTIFTYIIYLSILFLLSAEQEILISLVLTYIGKTRQEVKPLTCSIGSDNGCPVIMLAYEGDLPLSRNYKYTIFKHIDGYHILSVALEDVFVYGVGGTRYYLYQNCNIVR